MKSIENILSVLDLAATQHYWILLSSKTRLYWILVAAGSNAKRKEIQLIQPQMKKNYHHPTFIQYKKVPPIYFLFTVWKKIK
jgi:alpha-tubulin suppressor-like RCC1 family protein